MTSSYNVDPDMDGFAVTAKPEALAWFAGSCVELSSFPDAVGKDRWANEGDWFTIIRSPVVVRILGMDSPSNTRQMMNDILHALPRQRIIGAGIDCMHFVMHANAQVDSIDISQALIACRIFQIRILRFGQQEKLSGFLKRIPRSVYVHCCNFNGAPANEFHIGAMTPTPGRIILFYFHRNHPQFKSL